MTLMMMHACAHQGCERYPDTTVYLLVWVHVPDRLIETMSEREGDLSLILMSEGESGKVGEKRGIFE